MIGGACSCRRGIERDNCPACEGTGQRIDFAAHRAKKSLMAVNLDELLESWINGNRSYVRDQVRNSSYLKSKLALLIAEHDSKEQAEKYIEGF